MLLVKNLEILNNFLTKDLAFLFCTGLHKLCSQSQRKG